MSGSDERDDDGPAEGRSDAGPAAAPAAPVPTPAKAPAKRRAADEDALELDDLDALGVDGVLAQLRQGEGPEEPVPPAQRRVQRGRSPMLSIVVIGVGLYMLCFELFADFRYWLQSNTPRDLGDASSLAKNGKMPDDLHDTYVDLRGTPDVQHALRGTTKTEHVGYLRLIEGGGGLFAAVRRPLDQPIRDEFEGRFVGRMQRLDRSPAAEWIEQYFNAEDVERTIDAEPAALWSALASAGETMEIATAEGKTRVGAKERVRLIVHPPDVRVQLGRLTWPDAEKAEAAVAALGYPYVVGRKTEHFHSFVARIPEAERARVQAKLDEGVVHDPEKPDPKVGALLLPGTVAFSAGAADYRLDGDLVTLPREGASGPVLYDVTDGKLVPRPDVDGRAVVPKAWVSAVRIDEPIVFDKGGYLLMVGDEPSDHRLPALGWLVIAALVAINAASLVRHFRRRAAA